MAPRRILMTGGHGFVGTHLRAALAAAVPGTECLAPRFELTDYAAMRAAVAQADADCVIHLAAMAAAAEVRAAPERAWQVNLHATLALARAVQAQRADAVFLFVSSGDIYGDTFRRRGMVDEEAVPAPLNLYSVTKAAADLALGQLAAEGLRAIRLRAFNHTGPGQSNGFVVAAFAEQIARIAAGKQEAVMRVGALAPQRDFLDVRDVCAAYVRCVETSDALQPGVIMNIASGTPRRVGDVLSEMLAIAQIAPKVETASERLRPTDIACAVGDASRARDLLGWAPVIPWEQTLRDTLQYWGDRV
jgi:GDP-4-dehydro-6-deoxy-D-mannose reductase